MQVWAVQEPFGPCLLRRSERDGCLTEAAGEQPRIRPSKQPPRGSIATFLCERRIDSLGRKGRRVTELETARINQTRKDSPD